jgi:phosphatidylinositol glycan class T
LADNPIPRPVPNEELKCDTSKPYNSPDTCYPPDDVGDSNWSFTEIFGHPLRGSCPLSENDEEAVCLIVPDARNVFTSGGAVENKDASGYKRCFKLTGEDMEMVLTEQDLKEKVPLEQPLLYAERSFTGYGQERGGVQVILTNPSPTNSVDFVYMESLPWFMKLYLHTLKAKINGSPADKNLVKEMYYRPAHDRVRGTQLEIRMSIPADSTVVLTYDFEKAILRYTEYPPDANRGFDIPAAVITVGNVSIRTTSLLLPLPTPDFSMPYNVIILTSTVIALAFGNIFNLLVRRFVAADEAPTWNVRALRVKVLERVQVLVKRFKKKEEKVESKEE